MNNFTLKTDEELIDIFLSQRHQQVAFTTLYNRYKPRLYQYIKTVESHISSNEIFDFIQEIFIKTFRNIEKLRDKTKFEPWLFTIARNTLFSHYRKKNLIQTSLNDFFDTILPDTKNTPEKYLRNFEIYQLLIDFEKTLSKDEQIIFTQRIYHVTTIQKIAKAQNLTVSQLKYRFKQIIEKLKIFLKKEKFLFFDEPKDD